MRKVGFNGTSHGMTADQYDAMREQLKAIEREAQDRYDDWASDPLP